MAKNKDGKSYGFLFLIYIGVPIIGLLVWFITYLYLLFSEDYYIASLAISILVVLVIFLTRRLNKLYSGISRRLALIYLWVFSFVLIVMINDSKLHHIEFKKNYTPSWDTIKRYEERSNKINLVDWQFEAFGFKLEEKFEIEHLIYLQDGFVDMVYINIYQVKDSHIELIRDLFRKNVKYVEKNTWNICSGNRYSNKAVANNKTEIYYDSYCGKGERNGDNNVSAECIVFSKFEDAIDGEGRKHEICLFDKYLQFYYGEM